MSFYSLYFTRAASKSYKRAKESSAAYNGARKRGWANLGLRAPPHGKLDEGHPWVGSALQKSLSRGNGKERLFTAFIQNVSYSK